MPLHRGPATINQDDQGLAQREASEVVATPSVQTCRDVIPLEERERN